MNFKKQDNTNCIVVSCNNTYTNTITSIKFYAFLTKHHLISQVYTFALAPRLSTSGDSRIHIIHTYNICHELFMGFKNEKTIN